MKIKILLFCLLFFIVSCKGQGTKDQFGKSDNIEKQSDSIKYLHYMEPDNENMIVKKFDIKTFNANNKYGRYEFTNADRVEVEQVESNEYPSGKIIEYYEYRKYPNSPYKYYNEYDASGNIVESAILFYNVAMGTWKFYNLSGSVIKEENHDIGYPFTIDMLIDKMAHEYKVDLLDANGKAVYRYIDNKQLRMPIYRIEINIESDWGRDVYLVNGNTGKTLYKAKRPLEEDVFNLPESVEDEYLNSLKEGNAKTTGVSLNGGETNSLATEDFPEI